MAHVHGRCQGIVEAVSQSSTPDVDVVVGDTQPERAGAGLLAATRSARRFSKTFNRHGVRVAPEIDIFKVQGDHAQGVISFLLVQETAR